MIKDPDVAGPPVIKGIAGIAESLRRGGRPRLIFLKAQFGLRGKRHVAMQRLVGADADKRSKTSPRGQPVGKGRNKRFKGHFRLIKRKKPASVMASSGGCLTHSTPSRQATHSGSCCDTPLTVVIGSATQ